MKGEKENETPIKCSQNTSNAQSCPICLKMIKNDIPIGIPEGCHHVFCRPCIQQWSQKQNSCPLDRHIFENIIIKNSITGNQINKEKVQAVVQRNETEDEIDSDLEDDEYRCEICGGQEREEVMLICDRCDLAYHYDTCLIPPLYSVPLGHWYCSDCDL